VEIRININKGDSRTRDTPCRVLFYKELHEVWDPGLDHQIITPIITKKERRVNSRLENPFWKKEAITFGSIMETNLLKSESQKSEDLTA
jgi:hypothetical protein